MSGDHMEAGKNLHRLAGVNSDSEDKQVQCMPCKGYVGEEPKLRGAALAWSTVVQSLPSWISLKFKQELQYII